MSKPTGMIDHFTLSVVVPIYNERESLRPLFQEIYAALNGTDVAFEVVAVDDGSTDGSRELLIELAAKYPNFRGIAFRRNFGKAAALAAGFDHAQGKFIVTMDADGQDNPQEISRFLEALEQGSDLVVGWKFPRHDPFSKTLPSKLFNWATQRMSGVNLHDFNCGFKAYRRTVAQEMPLYGELFRFVPVFADKRGWRVNEIKVSHRSRRFGRSKFGADRMFRGFFDFLTVLFITKYLQRPLHFIGGIGVLFFVAGFAIECYMTVLWFLGDQPIGTRPLFFLGVLSIIVGFQLLTMGLLGELIIRLLHKNESNYSIETIFGIEDKAS